MNKDSSFALSTDNQHIWHPFDAIDVPENILVTHAKGIYLYTHTQQKIIDAIGSWWVNIHGHSHPELVEALTSQIKELDHVIFSGFTHLPAVNFTDLLLKTLDKNIYNKVFYSDNGSTSTEVALKMAIQYWHNLNRPRYKILALEGAYHGDTFGAMAAGDRSKFNEPFFPFLFEVDYLPFPNSDNEIQVIELAKNKLYYKEYAAFICEPLVQGAAGMRMYNPSFLQKIWEICNQTSTITIADEVFTGFYRTGKFLASDHVNSLRPDIICLSKAITGGLLPLGATVCKNYIFEAFQSKDVYKTFFHGHSYTGNPLALALAYKSLEILLNQETQNNIEMICMAHNKFCLELNNKYNHIHTRLLGTILAIEIKDKSVGYFSNLKEEIYNYFLNKNILLRPLGNVIYFLPMYIFSIEQLKYVYLEIENYIISKTYNE
ncbi:MAG: adenosylmethionine--8-amino-7-oxononanoate transaminase [Cytophagales bacterium]